MTHHTDIKTLKDGSIDYAHYIARSHQIRSNDAHQALAAIWRSLRAVRAKLTPHIVFRPGPARSKVSQYPIGRSA